MKKLFGFALFLGASLGISASALAQDNNPQADRPDGQERIGRKNGMDKMRAGRRGDGTTDRRGGMMRELENLNLSDAQKQQLRNLRRNNQSGAAVDRTEMRQLIEAQRNGTLTSAQQSRLSSLREQRRADAERMQQQVLAILTPEQREQLSQTQFGRRDGTMGAGGRRMRDDARAENRGDDDAERSARNGRRGDREMRTNRARGGDRLGGARFEGLNLTDAQREQLRNLRTNNNSNTAIRQEMRELRQAKQNGILTPQQETRLKSLRQQAKADAENQQQQILSILTPEQRRQLEQNNLERKGQKRERRQNRMTQTPGEIN